MIWDDFETVILDDNNSIHKFVLTIGSPFVPRILSCFPMQSRQKTCYGLLSNRVGCQHSSVYMAVVHVEHNHTLAN
ncbi:MAG TPA: hypothetical protein P5198_07460, partial [Flexilinea sp.]|nr:hypothetical protein [Flexilinea sp.]